MKTLKTLKYITLLIGMLLMSLVSVGQTIVVNGTSTNEYVPMYNYWSDFGFRSEYIIPASYFSTAGITNGASLNSITLYRSATGAWTGKDLTIKLTNTSTSYYSSTSFLGLNGTTVYTNSSYSGGSSSSYTFTFSSPFTYTGGSLVVHIYSGNGGSCSSSGGSTWYGISGTTDYQGCYANGSSSASATTGTRVNFLPKTAFSYTAVTSPHTLAGTIQCGQTVSGTLGTSGSIWGRGTSPYNMNSSYGVGAEAVYAFTPQMTGTHTIISNTASGDPDFWILS